MFDLFASSTIAFNQAMLLLAALFCLGFGALLLGHEIHWRLHALRIDGVLIGVREKKPGMFNSVYLFMLPSGQSVEATSNVGSNSTKGRDTGHKVKLLVFPDRPEDVSDAGSAIAGIIGVVLLLVGLWPLHAALTRWPINLLTLVMLAAGIGYIAYRMRAKLIPPEQRATPADWKLQRRERYRAELAALPVQRIEDLLATPEAVARRLRDRKTMRVVGPLLIVIGLALIALAIHLGREVTQRQASGQRTTGSVIALHEQSGSDGSLYYPVVRFVAADGATIDFRDRTGANPPSQHVGNQVRVLYGSESPVDSAIIDRGVWNWLPAVAVALFGCFLLFASARMLAANADKEGVR